MLISFIIPISWSKENFWKTIESIDAQKNKNFEIIIIHDKASSNHNDDLLEKLKDYFLERDNVKLVINSNSQGISENWNIGVTLSKGEYIVFSDDSVLYKDNFVDSIINSCVENDSPDIIEFKSELGGLAHSSTTTFIEPNKIYSLSSEYEPFAYINDFIFNKAFNSVLIKNSGVQFKKSLRYDILFTYKLLAVAKNYMYIDSKESLMEILTQKINYSVFDLTNQWPHIFNYYRRVGKFKDLKDNLKYSYFKIIVHFWLWNIKRYDDPALLKKAVSFVDRKFGDSREEFIKNNIIFKNTKDEKFKEIVLNYENYIKDILKLAK